MKRLFALLCCLTCFASVQAETPTEFSKRFFHALYKRKVRGAPDTKELHQLSPYLGTELIQLFKRIESQRDREQAGIKHKYRNDPSPPVLKGIWSKEGDLFTNIAESFTTFAIGKPRWRNERVHVPVHLEYGSATPAYAWSITLILDKADQIWVASDFLDEDGSSLRFSLNKEIANNRGHDGDVHARDRDRGHDRGGDESRRVSRRMAAQPRRQRAADGV